MPNTSPSVVNRETLELVEDLYERKAVCDYGLFLGATGNFFKKNLIHRLVDYFTPLNLDFLLIIALNFF